MPFIPRTKPNELIIFELLNRRMNLSSKEKLHFLNLRKGYEGEKQFDSLTEKLQCECLILNDLLLEINNTTFQIDSLVIAFGKVHIYEVKNYEGDFYYEGDKLFKKPRLEVINPLYQLSRSESLLRQSLLSLGSKLQISASVVFINPKFTLYQAPLDKPIIFPTQLTQHMESLNGISSKLTDKDIKVANQLLAANITDSPYNHLPSYDYDNLRKGITCPKCHSYFVSIEKRTCVCPECGEKEPVADAVVRSVNEFKILFPGEKITTNIIYDWCQIVQSKKMIRRILADNFHAVGSSQWTYYE
ncbi:nuclease-related domain-containing protein [Virgibacillus kekensis]|uniref:Nuclease-related domain-containing protein n=1 Tax=Virgibacillus kekensis TaxID=202261 RepID=A0ABV9DNC0_9BACI